MARDRKQWLVLGAGALAAAVIVGLVVLAGGSDDSDDRREEESAPATAPVEEPRVTIDEGDDGQEEVVVRGIRDRLERSLGLGDPSDLPVSSGPVTAAFRATDTCQAGSSAFEVDLDLTLLSLDGDRVRTETRQAPSQTTTGVIDLDTGAFVWAGRGTGYEELYYGIVIPLQEDEDGDILPLQVAFIGLNAFSTPTFTAPLGEPDTLVDTVEETFNPYADDIAQLVAGLRDAAIALPADVPPAEAAATLVDDGTLGEAAQALADLLVPEALPAPVGDSVQQPDACALGLVAVAPGS